MPHTVQKASNSSAADNSSDRRATERIGPVPFAFVAGIAFVLRAMWLVRPGSGWTVNPDSILYVALARGMVHGCGFAPYNGSCGAPEVLRTPGYPLFLIPFLSNFRWAIVAQALIGALVCLFVAGFAARRYGRLAGIVAATLVAVDVPMMLVGKELMAEPLFQAFAIAAVLASLEGRGIMAGAMVALSALVRPVGLVLIPVVVLAALLRRGWRAAAAAFGISLLIVGGWAVRNYRETGNLTLSVEGGYNLYSFTAPSVIARHDRSTLGAAEDSLQRELDSAVAAEHLAARAGAEAKPGVWGSADAPAVSSFMFWRAVSIIVKHPIDTAIVTLDGFIQLAFRPYQLETGWHGFVRSLAVFRFIRFVSTTVQGLIIAILWIGVARAFWKEPRDTERWLLFLSAALLLLAASPFGVGVNERYRSPAIPFLALLAATGWSHAGRSIADPRSSRVS